MRSALDNAQAARHTVFMTNSPATPKQISYILSLVNRRNGTRHAHLSQARRALGLSSSKVGRGLSRAEASAIIDELRA